MNIEMRPPEGKNQILWPNRERSPSRVRPPHQLRVGNIHEPQTGVDITGVLTERQTQALRSPL